MPFQEETLENKTYIVTGGASGIGRATAVLLSARGANVVVADADVDAGTAAAESIGPHVAFVETALESVDSLTALVSRTVELFGSVDGLANVAAVHRGGSFLDTTVSDWDTVEQINHRAVFFLSQAVAKAIIEQGSQGAIVNVASGAAFRPVPDQSAYSGSKGGVVALTRSLAGELAPHGIRVNLVSPGHTATESVLETLTDEQLGAVADKLLWKRWLTPEEVAESIVFLLSDLSRGMTGATVMVNQGDLMPH
ncbi:SDR family NAD(P)-dependent oxidoreductase [Rhodococcoides yunnanense]|uniref:SDR family NAD(P)-dependent oxidoreductase n=1 Tax=Rhodococcoides yunnanense TaxID=278209 RepID=UPI000932B2F0|nr:SDR family oxidoreductase [Rhodococcus yunnanensis]